MVDQLYNALVWFVLALAITCIIVGIIVWNWLAILVGIALTAGWVAERL